MPVSETVSKWDTILSAVSTSGSDWVTTTTTPYIWTTSTTPITAGSSTITITYPDLATREYEFPCLDTYNLESPKGREKYLSALRDYLNFYFVVNKNPK